MYYKRIVYFPKMNTSNLTNAQGMFADCSSLVAIPQFNTSKVTSFYNMFYRCLSLISIPQLDTSNVTEMNYMFVSCYSLISIPQLNTSSVTNMNGMFDSCYSPQHLYIGGLKVNLNISALNLISKDSLLYIINNESATSAITIKLSSYAYTRLAEDTDILEALTNHPNVSISR